MSDAGVPSKVELVGPAGRIVVRESDLSHYRRQGYVTLAEHVARHAEAPSDAPTAEDTEIVDRPEHAED